MSRFRRQRYATALVLALVGSVLASCSGSTTANATTGLASVQLTPVAKAPELALDKPQAKPVVVNMWATWCTPCRKELPAFQAVATARADDVRIVGVNIGEDRDAATAFLTTVGVTFDQYLDPDAALRTELSITSLPATVIINKGAVVATHRGALTEKELNAFINAHV